MANSLEPDEMAHYKPSNLDKHRLQKNRSRSVGSKGLKKVVCSVRERIMSLSGRRIYEVFKY